MVGGSVGINGSNVRRETAKFSEPCYILYLSSSIVHGCFVVGEILVVQGFMLMAQAPTYTQIILREGLPYSPEKEQAA